MVDGVNVIEVTNHTYYRYHCNGKSTNVSCFDDSVGGSVCRDGCLSGVGGQGGSDPSRNQTGLQRTVSEVSS